MTPTQFPARDTIAGRMSGFVAHLRNNGLIAGPPETAASLAALSEIDAFNVSEVRMALKAVCATDIDRQSRFDDLFDAYWLNKGTAKQRQQDFEEKTRTEPRHTSHLSDQEYSSGGHGSLDAPDSDDDGEAEMSGEGKLVGSQITNLNKTDLRTLMTPKDLARAEAIALKLARSMRDRRSRRRKAAKRGQQLDLRRIARHSVSHGGEPIELLRKRRPDRPVRIVALLDVSGSMTVYARVFLAFLKGLISADVHASAFLFHTRLVCISDALRDHDTMRAVGRMSLMAEGFGGGTRIGTNLKAFTGQYAGQLVNSRTVVLILSDGYDTDPPDEIAKSLARLKRRGCKIIWLNPLKGWAGYEPVARGMAAAVPYIDLFKAANTLEDLSALEHEFARL